MIIKEEQILNDNEEFIESNNASDLNENEQFVERLSSIDDDEIEYYERMFEKQAPRRFIVRQKRGMITHKTNNGYQPPKPEESIDPNDSFDYSEEEDGGYDEYEC